MILEISAYQCQNSPQVENGKFKIQLKFSYLQMTANGR